MLYGVPFFCQFLLGSGHPGAAKFTDLNTLYDAPVTVAAMTRKGVDQAFLYSVRAVGTHAHGNPVVA